MSNVKFDPLAYTATEAAEMLRVSKPTILQLLQRDDFPGIKVNTKWLIPRKELEEWLSKRTVDERKGPGRPRVL